MTDRNATSTVADVSEDRQAQLAFYEAKLAYETDSADLQAALELGQDVVVVDGRSAEAFEREHIPGAINIPHRSISADSLASLSRTSMYVAYCDGIGCNASTKTAARMARLGFRVNELIGGLDWWKRDGCPTEGKKSQSDSHTNCGCAG